MRCVVESVVADGDVRHWVEIEDRLTLTVPALLRDNIAGEWRARSFAQTVIGISHNNQITARVPGV